MPADMINRSPEDVLAAVLLPLLARRDRRSLACTSKSWAPVGDHMAARRLEAHAVIASAWRRRALAPSCDAARRARELHGRRVEALVLIGAGARWFKGTAVAPSDGRWDQGFGIVSPCWQIKRKVLWSDTHASWPVDYLDYCFAEFIPWDHLVSLEW